MWIWQFLRLLPGLRMGPRLKEVFHCSKLEHMSRVNRCPPGLYFASEKVHKSLNSG